MSDIETLEPGLRRIIAPNPSPMTGPGTNTYLLGTGECAVIDPGPDMQAHLEAILSAVSGVSHILVTHAHSDHSALTRTLSEATGAPVLAFGDARAGRSATMRGLDLPEGGAGIDATFAPDRELPDGAIVTGDGWSMSAHWTPGHFGNHLCFAWKDIVFTGDLVMGWSSSVISPPDGDLGDYLASCAKLRAMKPRRLFPGHGAPVEAPGVRIDELVAHRRQRSAQILAALADGPADAMTLARHLYADLPPDRSGPAVRTTLAHLIRLRAGGFLQTDAPPTMQGRFKLR